MTAPSQESQVQDQKTNDKEYNFRALEAKFQRQLEQERAARLEAEKKAQEALASIQAPTKDEEDDDQPYVDHKKLDKKLNRFGQNTQSEIQKAMEMAKKSAKEELKQELWLENNPDFFDVLKHADKFAEKAPHLAETILRMPEGFDRQKLVYQNIKAMGIDKPEQKQPSIQDKIDANRRSPYYQPSGIANSPHSVGGDFSPTGQKSAYDKLQQLKKNLRL